MLGAFDWQLVIDKTIEGAIIGGVVGLLVGIGFYFLKGFLPKKPDGSPENRQDEKDDRAEPSRFDSDRSSSP